jgi:hypothetical protein
VHNPEEHSSHLLHGGSLKSRIQWVWFRHGSVDCLKYLSPWILHVRCNWPCQTTRWCMLQKKTGVAFIKFNLWAFFMFVVTFLSNVVETFACWTCIHIFTVNCSVWFNLLRSSLFKVLCIKM